MNTGDDDLASSRAAFESKVRQTYAAWAKPEAGGKGSPASLMTIGVIGTGSLALVAALLGGGLLYLPAAIPLVTVLAVLGARVRAARS